MTWKFIKSGLLAIGAMLGVGILITGFSDSASAMACPKPCWIELHCCCITPCPVQDGTAKTELDQILKNIKQANQLYGVKMPTLDSSQSLKSAVSPTSLSSAGLNAMQQAFRNALRGTDGKQGLSSTLAKFDPKIAEVQQDASQPVVQADSDASQSTIEKKASEIDKAFWSTTVLSRAGQADMSSLRLDSARVSNVDAMAYALVRKSDVARSAQSAADLENRLNQALTLSDEVRVNAEAKAQVSKDWQRVQEAMGFVIEARSSGAVLNDKEITKPSRASSNGGITPSDPNNPDQSYDFAKARSACEVAARQAVAEHNDLTDINSEKAYLPSLMQTVNDHDSRKSQAWDADKAVLSMLSGLYQDPAAAWNALTSSLSSRDRTSYLDQSRYSTAAGLSNAAVNELFAQRSTTAYGQRMQNPSCTPQMQQEAACLPYTTPAPGGSWLSVIGGINSYYATADRQYDAYNRIGGISTNALGEAARTLPDLPISTGGTWSAGRQVDGSNEAYQEALAARQAALAYNSKLAADQGSVLLQYRQEAQKRKLYWDAMRRGDNGSFGPTLSDALRQEFLTSAPSCFYGPVQSTPANIQALPGWFDVSPSCQDRSWTTGSLVGTQIDHAYLGGVDSSIWAVMNDIDDYQANHSGRAGVEKWADASSGLCSTAQSLAPAAGRSDVLPEIAAFLQAISEVRADTGNSRSIEINLP